MSQKSPGVSKTRLDRLDYYLRSCEEIAQKVSDGQIYDYDHNGTVVKYPNAIWLVANGMATAGVDPCKLPASLLRAWAKHILLGDPQPPAATSDSTSENPRQPRSTSTAAVMAAPAAAAPAESVRPARVNLPVRLSIYTLLASAFDLSRLDTRENAASLRADLEKVAARYGESIGVKAADIQAAARPVDQSAAQLEA